MRLKLFGHKDEHSNKVEAFKVFNLKNDDFEGVKSYLNEIAYQGMNNFGSVYLSIPYKKMQEVMNILTLNNINFFIQNNHIYLASAALDIIYNELYSRTLKDDLHQIYLKKNGLDAARLKPLICSDINAILAKIDNICVQFCNPNIFLETCIDVELNKSLNQIIYELRDFRDTRR